MIFDDEEIQLEYHSNMQSVAQLAVSLFENVAYTFGLALHLVDCLDAYAIVRIKDSDPIVVDSICETVNQRFKRKDGQPMFVMLNEDFGLVRVLNTKPTDLEYLH